jgi:ribulose-phosphate 3-epimerase
MKNAIVAPSLLACDFANLQREIEMVNASDADYFHVDIMDGVFVPNISMGLPVVEAIQKHAKKPLDVHLMIVINLEQPLFRYTLKHARTCTVTFNKFKVLGPKQALPLIRILQ